MPGEQCVGCDQCLDLSEGWASERHGLRGQATALRVREAEPLLVFPKDAVLFLEVVDDVALLLVDPAGHGDNEELQQVRKLARTGRGSSGRVEASPVSPSPLQTGIAEP